jgi:hypothetical protein
MADDLRERFRALDSLEFPHEEGPPETERIRSRIGTTGGRRAGTAVFALLLAAIAIGFAFRAFRTQERGPQADSGDSTVARPGTCDYGPWIEHCPEAEWARSVVAVAGLEIVDEQTVLVVGTSKGGEFLFWAMDPSLHGGVTPLPEIVASGEAVVTDRVDGVPIYRVGGDRRLWLWSSHGLNVWVDGRAPTPSAPSRNDIATLLRASESVPYTPATPVPGVTIPEIVGLNDQQSMRALNELGLNWLVAYRTVDGVDPWRVASVDPTAGTRVTPGTPVEVLVATRVTPLPDGAADALDCDAGHREAFGGPKARVEPGGSAYIVGNLPGIELGIDEVIHVTFEDEQWHGLWHVVRDGSVVAVVDYPLLDGEACRGSGVAGA